MAKLNILVTGSNGQLGNEIRKASKDIEHSFFFTDINELDITDEEAVARFISLNKIQLIINCAAYTQVDKAEDDEILADLINHQAVKILASQCKKNNASLIHISTDYVFDGTSYTPYSEDMSKSPLGVYGTTKLAGELAVLKSECSHLIIRTSWLYSSFGNNFVKTMERLTREKDSLKVVFDQVGTPTYAADLADSILKIINQSVENKLEGIYHFSNEGVCSWYDFAIEIRDLFQNQCVIEPCHSEEFPSKVKRPNFSVLDKTKIKETFGIRIPHWKESLRRCAELLQNNVLD